mmetsp:Transcript_65505/g.179714  ORF Transcript_65505/g.179714 Transcript_65505/m.179714 type:complete len:295 (-) Transcript_65505:323-1207(-)
MHPLDEATRGEMDALFETLLGGSEARPQTIRLSSRDLEVPMAGVNKKVARFTFAGLCGRPLGAEDYLGIASAFHTVLVEDVPQLSLNEINQVRRLITMIDAFYDNSVKLIISAAVSPDELWRPHGESSTAGAAADDKRDEVFAFDRTLSRLNEMRSHAYLVRAAAGGHSLSENALPILLFETGSIVTEREARDLFSSYDVDVSGALELPEVTLLLQDLSERRAGHRNVPPEQVESAFAVMDADGNGEVSEQEFVSYFRGSTLSNMKILDYGRGGAVGAPSTARRAAGVSRAAAV